MNLLTLAQARQTLWSFGSPVAYASATNAQKLEWDDKLNLVLEYLVGHCKPRHTFRRVNIPIYDGMVTLPRQFGSVYGMRACTGCCSSPLMIYSRFYEVFASSESGSFSGAAIPATDVAQTFRVPPGPFKLRTKTPDSTENEGSMKLLGGRDADWDEYLDTVGVSLLMTNTTQTTSRIWTSLPQIQKVATTHAVELYSVDSANAETLIAIYAPGETVPAYPRYLIPASGCPGMVQALCKLAFVPVVADTDIVYPSNRNALIEGMTAVDRRAKGDYQLMDSLWQRALNILDNDRREFDGDGNVPTMRWQEGFGAGDIPAIM
jgi:hypothetical protein